MVPFYLARIEYLGRLAQDRLRLVLTHRAPIHCVFVAAQPRPQDKVPGAKDRCGVGAKLRKVGMWCRSNEPGQCRKTPSGLPN